MRAIILLVVAAAALGAQGAQGLIGSRIRLHPLVFMDLQQRHVPKKKKDEFMTEAEDSARRRALFTPDSTYTMEPDYRCNINLKYDAEKEAFRVSRDFSPRNLSIPMSCVVMDGPRVSGSNAYGARASYRVLRTYVVGLYLENDVWFGRYREPMIPLPREKARELRKYLKLAVRFRLDADACTGQPTGVVSYRDAATLDDLVDRNFTEYWACAADVELLLFDSRTKRVVAVGTPQADSSR